MPCPDIEMIELYIQGLLKGSKLAEFEVHLQDCTKCSDELGKAQDNESLLSEIKAFNASSEKISPDDSEDFTKEQAQALLPERHTLSLRIGYGGDGDVFKAYDAKMDRLEVIKFSLKTDSNSDDRWREARLMGGLNHANIVTVYNVGEKDGRQFIIMEWIDGRPLTDAWKGKPFRQKLNLYLNILDAIAVAHERGIVHRDIKPSNLLVAEKSMVPKVLDFGISIEHNHTGRGDSGIYRGSPPFSAPEQITPPFEITFATDVFALGILLYNLLTEQWPFPYQELDKLFNAIRAEQPKTPTALNASVPAALEQICLKALEKDPSKRYPDAQSLCDDIKNYLQGKKTVFQMPVMEELAKEGPYISNSDDKPVELPITEGDVLDNRYRVIKRLEDSSCIYQTYDIEHKRDMAVKVVSAGTEPMVSRLKHELLARNDINDFAHIIRAYDSRPFQYEGFSLFLLTMEYANEGNLRSWLNEYKDDMEFRISRGLEFFKQVCYGIQAVHDAGWAHLDVKPENLLLCDGNKKESNIRRSGKKDDDKLIVKISDFGISRNIKFPSNNNPSVMRDGLGTPQYSSPEQFQSSRHQDVGYASDIYSLGIILFELLDGTLPFDGNSEELKDKHLLRQPPELPPELKHWERVIKRCLTKAAKDRYAGIEQLTRDLENVERGFAASVDVACPNCGYINADPKVMFCEGCGEKLPDTFFRPCIHCIVGLVRLDQENCPHCGGKGVAAYYLLEQRKKQLAKLKNEEPVGAIKLLQLILREGAGDFRKEAKELLGQLNQKQTQIVSLRSKAEKAESSGAIKQAIEFWQEVLDIVPLHKAANEQINRLEPRLKEFTEQRKKAVNLMDEARFREAEEALKACLKFVSNHKGINEMRESCRIRSKEYDRSFEKASELFNEKLLVKSQEYLKAALSQAPNSHGALTLEKDISKKIREVKNLLNQIRRQLSWADFRGASETINHIKQLHKDNERVGELEKELTATEDSYVNLMTDAELAKSVADLSKAVSKINSALKLCPDSPSAKAFLEQLRSDQQKARDLLKQASSAIKAAVFEEAETFINQAEAIWPSVNSLKRKKEGLAECRSNYNSYLEQARKAETDKDLASAQDNINSALSVCPDSEEALAFKDTIERLQKKFHQHINNAGDFCDKAEFDEAGKQVKAASDIWPNNEEIEKLKNRIDEIAAGFSKAISMSKKYLNQKKFKDAMNCCEVALQLCPKSPQAISLRNEIIAVEKKEQKRQEERRRKLEKFYGSLGKSVPVILKLLIILTVLAGVIWLVRWGIISFWGWLTDHGEDSMWYISAAISTVMCIVGWGGAISSGGIASWVSEKTKSAVAGILLFVIFFPGVIVGSIISVMLEHYKGMGSHEAQAATCAILLVTAIIFLIVGLFVRKY